MYELEKADRMRCPSFLSVVVYFYFKKKRINTFLVSIKFVFQPIMQMSVNRFCLAGFRESLELHLFCLL